MVRPLDDITVVALEHAVAAPFCTRHLADMGARVIKVERPHSGDFARGYDSRVDGLASHFVWANRSKESLVLDLKQDEGRRIVHELVARADVLVQNLAPGAAERLGLGFERLHALHPRLIVCDISGYGDTGPYRNKKAYDLMIQSEAGFLSITGGPDAPAKAGCSIADISAGVYAVSGVLSALLLRERTGLGSRIDIAMLETMADWMGYPLYYAYNGQEPPPRTGATHATIAPYGPFTAGDGRQVMLGLQNEREWASFCNDVLGRPELARDPRFDSNSQRSANRHELSGIIEASFSQISAEDLLVCLDRAGIANAAINSVADLWNHPQLAARDRWRQVETPVGPVPALLLPGLPSSAEPRMDAVPALGAHSANILRELGYDDEQVDALQRAGVVAHPPISQVGAS